MGWEKYARFSKRSLLSTVLLTKYGELLIGFVSQINF